MRCDECKHWKFVANDWEAAAIGFGQCSGVRERWRITDEASDGIKWGDGESEYVKRRKDALKAAKAYVQDGSEYMANLLTAPDFFCALHTTKTEGAPSA